MKKKRKKFRANPICIGFFTNWYVGNNILVFQCHIFNWRCSSRSKKSIIHRMRCQPYFFVYLTTDWWINCVSRYLCICKERNKTCVIRAPHRLIGEFKYSNKSLDFKKAWSLPFEGIFIRKFIDDIALLQPMARMELNQTVYLR